MAGALLVTLLEMKERKLSDFRRGKLGVRFQDLNLMNPLTVQDNLLLPLALEGLDYSEMIRGLERIKRILGIKHLLMKVLANILIGQNNWWQLLGRLLRSPS